VSVVVTVSISDPTELRSLRNHMADAPGVAVSRATGAAGDGELGAWDVLQVAAAGGGAIVVAIKMIPEFIRSRRRDVSVTVKIDGDRREVVITAANAEDAVRLIEKAMNA
jgi:hypothetical protein